MCSFTSDPLYCGYVTWLNCLPVCMSEITKETYSGPIM